MSADSGEEAQNSRHACAACKHQRKKCQNDCVFAPYFPANKANNFREVHKIFGVKNMTGILETLGPDERKRAVESLEWEASAWRDYPVDGPLGLYRQLEQRLELSMNQQNPQQNAAAAPHQTSSSFVEFNQNSSGIVPDTNMNVATNFGYGNNPDFGLDEITLINYAGLLPRADNIETQGLANYGPQVGPNYYPIPQEQRRSLILQERSLDAVAPITSFLPQQEMQRNQIHAGSSSTIRPAGNASNPERPRIGSQRRFHPYFTASNIFDSQRRGSQLRSNIADKL